MEWFIVHCNAAFTQHGVWWVAFLVAGLAGGFTHCLVMCGSFAACDRLCASTTCGTSSRMANALALPHHVGRLISYSALGFAASLLSSQLAAAWWWPRVSSAMLAVAGVMFLANCVASVRNQGHSHRLHRALASLPWVRGLLLGFLPCGLLYATLMMAATLTNPISGMVAMALFAMGTVPALWVASLGAGMIGNRWQGVMRPAGQTLMAFNGLSLLVMAAQMMR